jgi:two-component system, sensor histidine kinase YesM
VPRLSAGAAVPSRSIHSWVLLTTSLVILSVAGLAGLTIAADAKLRDMDALALREQDLVSGLYGAVGATHDLLEICIKIPSDSSVADFTGSRDRLMRYFRELSAIPRGAERARIVTDFGFMLGSYLEGAEASIRFRREGRLPEANRSHGEAVNMREVLVRQLPSLFAVMTADSAELRSRAGMVRSQNLVIDAALSLLACGMAAALMLGSMRRIIEPIRELTAAARRINAGSLGVRVPGISRDSEFVSLALAFNAMLDTIARQIGELEGASKLKALLHEEESKNQRSRLLVKEAELRAMQSRINPHFLFNTLNMILQSAYTERAARSAEMIESLAAMLQYLMEDWSAPVQIGDELRYTRDYVHIQNLRFGDRISFSIECPPSLEVYWLPRLVIQPLVENAIRHGVKDVIRDARISVAVAGSGGGITIEVGDSGAGMAREVLERVLRDLDSEESRGIGLNNVCQRLKLFFGGAASVDIRSAPGAGTVVALSFPRALDGAIWPA